MIITNARAGHNFNSFSLRPKTEVIPFQSCFLCNKTLSLFAHYSYYCVTQMIFKLLDGIFSHALRIQLPCLLFLLDIDCIDRTTRGLSRLKTKSIQPRLKAFNIALINQFQGGLRSDIS